jgi:hypothetical protein
LYGRLVAIFLFLKKAKQTKKCLLVITSSIGKYWAYSRRARCLPTANVMVLSVPETATQLVFMENGDLRTYSQLSRALQLS